MNNKGAIGVGGLIAVFVGIIFVASLFATIGSNVASVTDTQTVANQTITLPAAGVEIDVNSNARSLSNVVIINSSDTTIITATNYTINNNVIRSGNLASRLNMSALSQTGGYAANISYTYEPLTYGDTASRTMIDLVVILSALAVVAFVLWKVYDEGLSEFG